MAEGSEGRRRCISKGKGTRMRKEEERMTEELTMNEQTEGKDK